MKHASILGRLIRLGKRSAHHVVWFDFRELCGGAHSHPYYLEIADCFPTVFVSHIRNYPPISPPRRGASSG